MEKKNVGCLTDDLYTDEGLNTRLDKIYIYNQLFSCGDRIKLHT